MRRQRSTPRLADVAEAAGVSLATASRSMAGRDGVSAAVAARVRATALEIGYVVDVHARTLAGGSTSTVGLIVHEIGDPYFSEIASGVIGIAEEQGLTVQICHSGRDPARELQQIRTLIAHRTDTVIVAGSGYTDPAVQAEADEVLIRFQADGGRVAVIGRHNLSADSVRPDNEAAGRVAAGHLLQLGHRRIGVLAGPPGLTTVADRRAGVAAAVAAHGLSADALPVVPTDFTRGGGHAGVAQLLDAHPDVTAVIALSDVMAIGALSMLRGRGVAVPHRVSVVGVDDIPVAADLSPGLTTVRLPMVEMGAAALTMALKPPSRRRRRKHTGHELIVRDSTIAVSRAVG